MLITGRIHESSAASCGVSDAVSAFGIKQAALEKNMPARKFYADDGFTEAGDRQQEPGTTEYILKYEMDFADIGGKI